MNWKLFIPIIFWGFCWFDAQAQEVPLTHFTPDSEINALPSAMVTYTYQDSMGFIWLAVFSSGLVRYDGIRMDLYDQPDGLDDLGIWQMLEDDNGYLWVATQAGLMVTEQPLSSYKYGSRISFTSEFDGIQLSGEALAQNQIALDHLGRVWVGTSGSGFLRYFIDDTGKLHLSNISTDFNFNNDGSVSVISLFAKENGSMLAALSGGVIVTISEDDSKDIVYVPDAGQSANIQALYADHSGNIWAYNQDGAILYFSADTNRPRIITQNQPSNITGLRAMSDGTLWATSGTSGIIIIDRELGEIIGRYNRVNGLLSGNVFNVKEDRESNIWIAQSGGVSKFRYNFRAFQNYSDRSIIGEQPVLPSGRVNAILIPDDTIQPCKIWAGTENGAACISEQGESHYLTQEEGLSGNWVNGLAIDDSGRIWFATTQGLNGLSFGNDRSIEGAYNYQSVTIFGQDATLFSIEESPPFIAAEVLLFNPDDENRVQKSSWFPGLRNLYGVVGDRIIAFNSAHGLPATLYKAAAFDGAGHLWVGTLDRGIYRSSKKIDGQMLNAMTTEDPDSLLFEEVWSRSTGAFTNHIEKLFWYNGLIWIGTQEGLAAIDPDNFDLRLHLTTENGLPADNTISFDRSPATGNFWAGTNRGLVEINPESGDVLNIVTRQDGLIDNEVWLYGAVKTDQEGKVYFGTANGLSIYNPALDRENEVPPLLQLTSMELLYLSEGRNEAIFEFAALSFGNTSSVRYQTRLLGYDDDWSPQTADVRLRYTNLPAYFWAKNYTLEVRAVNESGVWSDENILYTFQIEPVWWLKWWAFLGYFIVLSFGVIVVDRIQRARLIKKERDVARLREAELQAETATARTKTAEAQAQALKAENDRKALELEKAKELEIAYHELKSAQKQLIQAEKMASLGRLSTGIAHEIKNPLNFINNFAGVSNELVDELITAIKENDKDEIDFLITNLKHNSEKIEEHGKRADSIVKSMMQHARGGKAEYEFFDINNMIEKYVNLAYHGKKSQIQDFHAEINTELEPGIKEVKAVGQEISQVLLNIIGNSLDAVWDYKKKVNGQFEPEIKISTKQLSNSVEIRIADNGPGVPDEIKEKIFEPFFTTKPTGEGTGLGLSLSYDIITQGHNGTLTLETESGKGATFIITLPLS